MSNIILPVAELKPALTGLGKVISRKPTLPILGAILITRNQDGWVALTGTDLDSFATVRLEQPEEGGAPATVLVPHAELAALIKGCAANDTITVEQVTTEQALLRYPIGSQTGEKRTASFPAEDFPPIPKIEMEPFPVPQAVRSAIGEALECASTDETRYVLNSAYLDVSDKRGGHYVVATDGRHLYASNSFQLPLESPVILPDRKFLGWKPFAEDGEWRMAVQPGKGKDDHSLIQLSSRRWKFITTAIEGNYPNWRQVIPGPDQFKTSIQLNEKALDAAAKLIPKMPCHDAINGTIGIRVDGRKLTLRARGSADAKWTDIEIDGAAISGSARTVYLNRKYLLRAVQFGLGEIQVIDELSPLRFLSAGRQMIVMPIRADGPVTPTAAAPAPTSQTEETTNERRTTMQTPTSTSNGNGHSHNVGNGNGNASVTAPEKPALETALEQAEAVRESLKGAVTSVTALVTSLRLAQREQRASEKEIQGVRTTLEKLQAVRI